MEKVRVSVTMSESINNGAEEDTSMTPATALIDPKDTPKLPARPTTAGAVRRSDHSRAATTARHSGNTTASMMIMSRLDVATMLSMNSGSPFTPTVTVASDNRQFVVVVVEADVGAAIRTSATCCGSNVDDCEDAAESVR